MFGAKHTILRESRHACSSRRELIAVNPMESDAKKIANVAGSRRESWDSALAVALLLLAIALSLLVQRKSYLNHDVAFYTWVADQVIGPKSYGHDVYDSNPPLSFLLYSPAGIAGRMIGFDLAVRLWICTIALLAVLLCRKASPEHLRTIVPLSLALFFALGLPREFGQREQLALLLCAPYVSGSIDDRRWALASGVMAGIGFSIKPYFLVALGLVFLSRRKVKTEECAIAFTGIAYALLLLLCFREYIFEAMPVTREAYWAFEREEGYTLPAIMTAAFLLTSAGIWLLSRKRQGTDFLLAAIGFAAAAIIQGKYFYYHLLPIWGFMVLFWASRLRSPCLTTRIASTTIYLSGVVTLLAAAIPWITDWEKRGRDLPKLIHAIDQVKSFGAISIHPYPAFPAAIYTTSTFVGSTSCHWFLPAAAKIATGQVRRNPQPIYRMAIEQAVTELEQQPELVIVNTKWRGFSGLKSRSFDGLEWLKRDARFRQIWSSYRFDQRIGNFELYRLVS